MPLTISTDDSIYTNDATLSDAPAVVISGSRVRFTNSEAGRLISTNSAQPAIEVTGTGSTIINELGGIIRNDFFDGRSITGGGGNDRVENYGLISGLVSLGNGNDTYLERTTSTSYFDKRIDLGAGDDRYDVVGGQSYYSAGSIQGGSGFDEFVLGGGAQLDGQSVTGFERLIVAGSSSNVLNMSGLSEIVINPGLYLGLQNSLNPSVALALSGGSLYLGPGSSIGSITGSAAVEYVSLTSSTVTGAVNLGGGDDSFNYTWHSFFINQTQPSVGGGVNGGAGTDYLQLSVSDNRVVDLLNFTGFEQLNTGTFTSATSTLRILHADAFLTIDGDGDGGVLTIGETNAPNARVTVSQKGGVVIEASTTIGQFGYTFDVSQEQQGNDLFNISLINRGTVLGDAKLYIGDDLYDGRGGTVVGTVFGYAGNDVIYGGGGDDRLDGGFGRDVLIGGLGADTLIGGGGSQDTASYEDNFGAVFVNLTLGRGYANASFGDTYSGIENVRGSIFNDVLIGNDVANSLEGGSGNDILIGGLGADALVGGDGADIASYEDNQGAVFVNLALGRGYANASFDDTYTGIENARGSIYNDTLIGTTGVNILEGGAGNDVLIGGLGADSLIGGDGSDFASYEDNQGAVFVNLALGRGYANSSFDDTYSGIENARGGIYNDTLIGTTGINTLEGGGGDDVLIGGLGGDALIGGDGQDTASYEDNQGAVYVHLGLGRGYANSSFDDTYTGIENVRGGLYDDIIFGDDAANILEGGGGNDRLTGAGGADSFAFTAPLGAGNIDTITDFDPAADTIRLGASVFGAIGAGTLGGSAFATGSAASTAQHRIVYDSQTGALLYDADGSGAGAAIQFATIGTGLALTSADFLIA